MSSRPVAGAVTGFALDVAGRDATVWVFGDTVALRGTDEVVRRLDVDVAVLHLGGVRFGLTGPLRHSLTGEDAVALVADLEPRVVVPVHYEGWSHFADDRAAVEQAVAAAPADVRARFWWVPIGQPTTIAASAVP